MSAISFQDLARQRNALRSTGPITDDGKGRSRVNSTKHGFAGSGAVLSPEIVAEIAARRAMLPMTAPESDTSAVPLEDDWLLAGIRLEMCREARARLVRDQWELDHQADAEDLARLLPRRPGLVTIQLEKGSHGVDWKITRWLLLIDKLEVHHEFNAVELQLWYDLQGAPDIGRVVESQPEDEERLLRVAREELERLERWRDEVLVPNEEFDRLAAELGVPVNETKQLRLLRRYERELENKLRRLTKQVDPAKVDALAAGLAARSKCTELNIAEERATVPDITSVGPGSLVIAEDTSAQASPVSPDVNMSTVVRSDSRDKAADRSRREGRSRQADVIPMTPTSPPRDVSRDEAGDRSCPTEGSCQPDAPSVTPTAAPRECSRDEAGDRSRQREESRRRKERRKREKSSRRRSRQNR